MIEYGERVCYDRVCYERVCYERVYYDRVCYERVCYDRVCYDNRSCTNTLFCVRGGGVIYGQQAQGGHPPCRGSRLSVSNLHHPLCDQLQSVPVDSCVVCKGRGGEEKGVREEGTRGGEEGTRCEEEGRESKEGKREEEEEEEEEGTRGEEEGIRDEEEGTY